MCSSDLRLLVHQVVELARALDVSVAYLDNNSRVTRVEPFLTGWVKDNQYLGRPVDLLTLPDGSLLVSDDAHLEIVLRAGDAADGRDGLPAAALCLAPHAHDPVSARRPRAHGPAPVVVFHARIIPLAASSS